MIAKISATENLGGALGYNFKKVEQGEARVLLAEGLYQRTDGEYTMAEVLADMQALLPEKCRTKKTVFHCSLNPHPDETLSDEQLSELAQEYMQALGYGSQPYIVFKHRDIAREHIHIVSLRVDSEGHKISDKFEGRRSKAITDHLEAKYGLIPSSTVWVPSEQASSYRDDLRDFDRRTFIASLLRQTFARYSFCSLGELNAILALHQLAVEEVKTEYRGKKYDGLVYVPTDEEGNKVGTPIKASDIGRGVGYSAVQRHIQKSKQAIKTHIPSVRDRVKAVMQTSPKDEQALHERLAEQGLRLLIRKNEGGRIYGITFVDAPLGVALNGSRLGKAYSANQFNSYFTNPKENPFLSLDSEDTPKLAQTTEQAIQPRESEGDNLVDELVEDLVGEGFTTGNDDWKEAAWQRKLRRQGKPQLRRKKR